MRRQPESSIVTKCAQVMDILTRARKPLVFSEIARETGFVKSSCHRILTVLQSEELVEYDKSNRSYKTGERLHQWSRASWRRVDLQKVATDVMAELSEASEMNAALSVLDNTSILYLNTVEHHTSRYSPHVGDHAPLHCTAAGKVFLAYMSERRRNALMSKMTLEKFTEFTHTSVDTLSSEFPEILQENYAMSVKEEFLWVIGSASPIFNVQDQVTACLSLWTRTQDASTQNVRTQASLLRDAAREISLKIGWSPQE